MNIKDFEFTNDYKDDYEEFIGEDDNQFEVELELKSSLSDKNWGQFVAEIEELCHIHGVNAKWSL